MRSLYNSLGDPSLHLLAIALIVVFLAFSRGPRSDEAWAEAPLPTCQVCHGHYLPGKPCECRGSGGIAQFAR